MTDVAHLAYLFCTSQGIPLVTKILKDDGAIEARSSSHWKTICQYICLSSGLWKDNHSLTTWSNFSFSLRDRSYFVVSRQWNGNLLFCCVEVSPRENNIQPSLLAYYLLHHFCRYTSRHETSDGKKLLTQLLEEIAMMSKQLAEGTFADSVGVDQEELWENFLVDHVVRDDVLEFEEFLSSNYLASHDNLLHLNWLMLNISKNLVDSNKNIRFFFMSGWGLPLGAMYVSAATGKVESLPLESWCTDELYAKMESKRQEVSSFELLVVSLHDKVGLIQTLKLNELSLIITNIDKASFANNFCTIENISKFSDDELGRLVKASNIGSWIDTIVSAFSRAFE